MVEGHRVPGNEGVDDRLRQVVGLCMCCSGVRSILCQHGPDPETSVMVLISRAENGRSDPEEASVIKLGCKVAVKRCVSLCIEHSVYHTVSLGSKKLIVRNAVFLLCPLDRE